MFRLLFLNCMQMRELVHIKLDKALFVYLNNIFIYIYIYIYIYILSYKQCHNAQIFLNLKTGFIFIKQTIFLFFNSGRKHDSGYML